MSKGKYHFEFEELRKILIPSRDKNGNQVAAPSKEILLEMHKCSRSYWQECNFHNITIQRYYTTINILLISAMGYIWLNFCKEQLFLYLLASFSGIVVCCQWLLDRKDIKAEGITSRAVCDALEEELNCRVVDLEKHVLDMIDTQDCWKVKLLRYLDKFFDFPGYLIAFYVAIIILVIIELLC